MIILIINERVPAIDTRDMTYVYSFIMDDYEVLYAKALTDGIISPSIICAITEQVM
jgi:hypothetical protein